MPRVARRPVRRRAPVRPRRRYRRAPGVLTRAYRGVRSAVSGTARGFYRGARSLAGTAATGYLRGAANTLGVAAGSRLLRAGLQGAMGMVPGGSAAYDIGSALGTWLGRGAYSVKKNSLMTSDQVPFMHSSGDGFRIAHREFLADVNSTTTFTNTSYTINPGLSDTFPWLSAIAQNFEEYRIEGLVFEFKSTSADALNSTNTALGTLILAAEYNVIQPAYINKQQAENAMWAMSTKPSCSLLMPVECSPQLNPLGNLYIRTGNVPTGADARMYDLCNVQVMTVGSQATAVIGELWISYDIVLLKPQLSSGLALASQTAHYKLSGNTGSAPIGTSQTEAFDAIGLTIGATGYSFPLGSSR